MGLTSVYSTLPSSSIYLGFPLVPTGCCLDFFFISSTGCNYPLIKRLPFAEKEIGAQIQKLFKVRHLSVSEANIIT
jgi:hypothetical protein